MDGALKLAAKSLRINQAAVQVYKGGNKIAIKRKDVARCVVCDQTPICYVDLDNGKIMCACCADQTHNTIHGVIDSIKDRITTPKQKSRGQLIDEIVSKSRRVSEIIAEYKRLYPEDVEYHLKGIAAETIKEYIRK